MAGAESQTVIVLGIDPGLASTGYGVVARRDGRLLALDGGAIHTRAELALERRLAKIHAAVDALLGEHEPDVVPLKLYFGQNVRHGLRRRTGTRRGAARGRPARRAVHRLTPQQVKGAVCGSGAQKDQVARMV